MTLTLKQLLDPALTHCRNQFWTDVEYTKAKIKTIKQNV